MPLSATASPLTQVFAPFIDVGLYPTPRLLDFFEASAAAACISAMPQSYNACMATCPCLHS